MNSMKKILKEWKSFLRESDESSPTGTGERLKKHFANLVAGGISASEYNKKLAAKHIIAALKAFEDKEGFIKKNKKHVFPVLNELISLTTEGGEGKYFSVYLTGAQRDKVGSVSAIVALADFADWKVSFDDLETLKQFAGTLKEMISNDDYDFNIFKPETELVGEKPRSFGRGTGGVQKPPRLSPKEEEEFEAISLPWFRAAGEVLSVLDRSREITIREWYNTLLEEARQRIIFFSYLEKKWREKTDPNSYFSGSLIFNYSMAVADAEDSVELLKAEIANIQPTAEEKVEDLMAKAKAGDKEAAKEARKMLLALKRTKEARQMRMLSR